MNVAVQRFYKRARGLADRDSDLPDLFIYHLTIEQQSPGATAVAVRDCYVACDLSPPSWLASHLSKGLKSKPRRFVKVDDGYRLENRRREYISDRLNDNGSTMEVAAALDRLEKLVPAGPKQEFLHETINCLGVSAFRAATVMCWNLAMHHLQEYILADASRTDAFNVVLGKNTDTRVKIKVIAKQDDFTEMSESKFLLFCREARLITSSLFNKLETKLDERNAAAHPSGVAVKRTTTEAYIEDLVENVLLKFR